MKKLFLSFGLIVVFAFYVLLSSTRNAVSQPVLTSNTSDISKVITPTTPVETAVKTTIPVPAVRRGDDGEYDDDYLPAQNTVSNKVAPASQPTPNPIATPATSPTSVPTTATNTGKYKNGAYTGPVVDAYFGNVQVSAVVENGALTDVQFLQYPNDRGTSIRISNNAMPILKSEAIKAQNATVNGVSGATQTSDAFKISLEAALATALN